MTDREREFASLGLEYAEGIDLAHVITLPTGREVRKIPSGLWEVQPKNDNYWLSFADLLDAVKCGLGAKEEEEDPPYKGWTVRYGFLGGNLDDGSGVPPGTSEAYAEALRDALEEAYPGADIEVPYQENASGCVGRLLMAAVWDARGQPVDAEVENVSRISEKVFENPSWWPAPKEQDIVCPCCGETCYQDCQDRPRCEQCDNPCPSCDDGGGPR